MSRLTRDGTAKPVSRNQIFRRERRRKFFPGPDDHVNRIGNLLVVLYSAICDDNTYIYTVVVCTLNFRLLSGHLRVIAVGDSFPRRLWFGGCRLKQGTLTSICVRKNLNATVLQVTCTRVFLKNSRTGTRRRGKTCPYSTAVVVLIFCI